MNRDYTKGKIYIIKNTKNDKVYIGSTTQTLSRRMTDHRKDALKKITIRLYKAMNEIGIESFILN